jgi:hypothetical protein
LCWAAECEWQKRLAEMQDQIWLNCEEASHISTISGNTSAIRLDKIWLASSTRNHRCCICFKVKRSLSLSSLSLCSLALAEEQGCKNNTPRCKTRDPWKMCVFQKPEKKISLPLPVWVRIAYRNRSTKQSKASIMSLLSR